MLDRWCGAVRWLWNTSLGIRSEAYRECKLSLSGNDISVLRVDARDACFDDFEFIEQVLAEEARNGHRGRACQEQANSW